MAKAFSQYLRNAVLNSIFHSAAFPTADPVYISLQTGEPDAAANEVTGSEWTNYARVSAATTSGSSDWASPADTGEGGFLDNAALLDFGTATVTGTQAKVKGFGIHSALSGGNHYFGDWLITGRVAFIGLATDDTIYSPAHGFSDNDLVALVGSALPGGLAQGTEYYIINSTANSFQLSATQGGAAITLTTDGVGEVGISQFFDVADGDSIQVPIGDLDIVLA